MKIIDLTRPIPGATETALREVSCEDLDFRAVIHRFSLSSMDGTYLDLPSHVRESGRPGGMAGFPARKLHLVDSSFIRLSREGLGPEIMAAELAPLDSGAPGLVIYSGWLPRDWDSPEAHFLGRSAVEWIIGRRTTLLVSDAYENRRRPWGVFAALFRAGIPCVCLPANLERLSRTRLKISALPLRLRGATQAPCRLVALEE